MINYLCFRGTYCVRRALKEKIDGSVYIFVAVMKGNHALILSLPSYLNQLNVKKIGKQDIRISYATKEKLKFQK